MSPLTADDVPRLPRGVRLRFDETRQAHVLLAPERAFSLDPIAAAVLALVDGQRSIRDVSTLLAERHGAPQAKVEADVIAMLGDLADKRVLDR